MASRDLVYVRRDDAVAAQAVPDDLLVLDLRSGRYYGVGAVGAAVWELLDGSRNLGEIAAEVCRRFEVDTERAESDLEAFLASLEQRGLVRRSSATC